jgi:hypothetical protein
VVAQIWAPEANVKGPFSRTTLAVNTIHHGSQWWLTNCKRQGQLYVDCILSANPRAGPLKFAALEAAWDGRGLCSVDGRLWRAFLFYLFACAFLGASPTTSASILVEFGGNDWAAGCVVVHVFSHMYISPAVRHAPHARDLLFSIVLCMRGPRSLARNTGVRSQGVLSALGAYKTGSFSQSSP